MKKKTTLWPRLLAFALVCLSVAGIFEESAFNYLKSVAQNNVEFLAIVSDIKMIIAGISVINIPFISGHSQGVTHSLDKVESYLLITDSISFIQLMLFSITKSLGFKICLVIFFIISLIEKENKHITKILVLVLALSPGLSIYTATMHHIYDSAAIDFGSSYVKELDATVKSIKAENKELMRQHEKEIAHLDSSKNGSKVFKKLKADVAYDIKKVGKSVSGDFKEIRTLIKSSGHEITAKVSRFCSMIIFSLLLMPMGYALLIYVLFNSLFKKYSLSLEHAEKNLEQLNPQGPKKPLMQKLANISAAIKKEFSEVEAKIEHSSAFQHAKEKVVEAEKKAVSTVENKAEGLEEKAKSAMNQEVEKTKEKVENTVSNKGKQKPIKRSPGSLLTL